MQVKLTHEQQTIHADKQLDQEINRQQILTDAVSEQQYDRRFEQGAIFQKETVEELLMDNQNEALLTPEYEVNYLIVNDYSTFKKAPVLTEKDVLSEKALAEQRKWRDYIAKKFRLDEEKQKVIKEDDLKLKEVVERYFSDEEKNRIAHTTEEHFKEFHRIREGIIADKLMSAEEKGKALYNLTRIFAGDFAKFKVLYADEMPDEKRKQRILEQLYVFEKLMMLYDPDYDSEGTEPVDKEALFKRLGIISDTEEDSKEKTISDNESLMATIKERVRFLNKGKKAGKTPEQLEKEKQDEKTLSENLTEEQRRRILQTDYLLVKEVSKHPEHAAFLNKVMQLPPRQRLYMYYVIEQKGHLEAPCYSDAGLSQMGYVPNVDVIHKRLTKVPYRVWEVLSPDGLHSFMWEKVEAAYAQATRSSTKQTIVSFAKTQAVTAESILEEKKKEKIEETGEEIIPETELEILKKDADKTFELERQRDELLLLALKAAEECQEAVLERDKALFVTKWRKEKKVQEKSVEASSAMRLLRAKDVALAKNIDDYSKFNFKVGFKEEDPKIKGDMIYATSQSLTLLSKISLIPKLYSDPIGKIGFTQGLDAKINGLLPGREISLNGLLKGVNYSAAILGTMSGCVNLFASLKGVDSAIRMAKSGDYADDVTAVASLKAARGVVAGTYGIAAGATNFAYASKVANLMMGQTSLSASVGAMKTGLQVVGGAISGAGLLLDAADTATQVRQEGHRLYAMYDFHKVKKQLRLSDTEQAKTDEMYITNMMKLDRRNKIRGAVSTVSSVTANSIGLAAAITTAAGVGIGLAFASLFVSLTSKLVDYKMRSKNKVKTVDQFLKMDDLSWLGLPANVKVTKDLKKQIMQHMAAEMGFTTIKGLFNHIVRKYAAFVHNHLFFKDGKPIFNEKPDNDDMIDGCYEFVKGLGLKVTYPTNSTTAESERHPSIPAICSRLGC